MDPSEIVRHCRNTLLPVRFNDSRKARGTDSAIIAVGMDMEAAHRHSASCFTKETDDVKGEINEAWTWIWVMGGDRFGRTSVAKQCRSKEQSVPKANGAVAEAGRITGQCGVFR